jgi:NAD(P)-dependent dehydrogenase (short-subunit alcohol dehydrogenase family)
MALAVTTDVTHRDQVRRLVDTAMQTYGRIDVMINPVDAGPLRIAWYTEPFVLLVVQFAYEGEGGPELAYRLELLGEQA